MDSEAAGVPRGVIDGTISAQLAALYRDRALLLEALGCADAATLVALVRSLEEQLCDLYARLDQGEPRPRDGTPEGGRTRGVADAEKP